MNNSTIQSKRLISRRAALSTTAATLALGSGILSGEQSEQKSGRGKRTVGILMFNDVEVLDYAGPFEVFWEARPVDKDADEDALFRLAMISADGKPVRGRGGLETAVQYDLTSHPKLDILIVPGGRGAARERKNAKLLDWIAEQNKQVEILASVCTGAFLLAERGILDGHRATSHWSVIDFMKKQYPQVKMMDGIRYVDEGHVATSAGISAGIDLALHLVARLHGPEVAVWTARLIQYDYWREAFKESVA